MFTNKDNYLAISNILLTVTMLATDFDEQLEKDSSLIIDFIGHSFDLNEQEINYLKKIVCDDLTILSTTKDAGQYLIENGGKDYPEISDFLYLKMQAIMHLNNMTGVDNYLFNYEYLKPYYPSVRFKELESSSMGGNIDVNRTTALLLALGIGTKKDITASIYRFKQCAYWGDVISLFFLAELYKENNDEENAKLYKNLSILSRYFYEGRTVLPKDVKEKYDEKTIQNFAIISSIKQDIVSSRENRRENIDFSFIEVILLDNISYYDKIQCINEYESNEWKNITNTSCDPNKRLGFNIKGGK